MDARKQEEDIRRRRRGSHKGPFLVSACSRRGRIRWRRAHFRLQPLGPRRSLSPVAGSVSCWGLVTPELADYDADLSVLATTFGARELLADHGCACPLVPPEAATGRPRTRTWGGAGAPAPMWSPLTSWRPTSSTTCPTCQPDDIVSNAGICANGSDRSCVKRRLRGRYHNSILYFNKTYYTIFVFVLIISTRWLTDIILLCYTFVSNTDIYINMFWVGFEFLTD